MNSAMKVILFGACLTMMSSTCIAHSMVELDFKILAAKADRVVVGTVGSMEPNGEVLSKKFYKVEIQEEIPSKLILVDEVKKAITGASGKQPVIIVSNRTQYSIGKVPDFKNKGPYLLFLTESDNESFLYEGQKAYEVVDIWRGAIPLGRGPDQRVASYLLEHNEVDMYSETRAFLEAIRYAVSGKELDTDLKDKSEKILANLGLL